MFEWKSWSGLGLAVAVAVVMGLVVILFTALVARGAVRGRPGVQLVLSKARHPFRFLVIVVAIWTAVTFTLPDSNGFAMRSAAWHSGVDHGFLILTIAASTWLVAALVGYGLSLAVGRYSADTADNGVARRAQTQILVVRRLLIVVIVIVGFASVLLTFPGVQAIGASVLASAGLVSIVAGLAAQSTLGNVFAGVQLAFSDAIRLDDVVVISNQWGRIEEITLTYIVVRLWDDRRLVVPSTHFTSSPFENWTRTSSELLGQVDFDLDWRLSTAGMRTELADILGRTATWDGRTQVLQVTDAVGGFVHVRILVSAKDSPTLFDLRCFVREAMMEWVQQQNPQAMPRTRITIGDEHIGQAQPAVTSGEDATKTDQIGLFTGTEGHERANELTAATPTVRDTPTGN